MEHHLKIWPAEFKAICHGLKSWELRKNDRNFQVGDRLFLEEYDQEKKEYTGLYILAPVLYILEGGKFGLPEGMCIMSIGFYLLSDEKLEGRTDLGAP